MDSWDPAAAVSSASAAGAGGRTSSTRVSPQGSSSPFFQMLGLIRQQAEAHVMEVARLDPIVGLLSDPKPRMWGGGGSIGR